MHNKNLNNIFLSINFRKILITFFVILAFCTYITQYIFGFTEMVAEGLPLILGFIYLTLLVTKKVFTKKINIILTFYLILLIIFTQLTISQDNQTYYKYIFIFYYIPLFLLYCCSKKIIIDSKYIFKIITIISVITSFFSISQYFHLQEFIPLDNTRGRGMSRSTLNYSSLMLLGFIAADHCKLKFSKISKIIILFGAIFSLGRGGILSIIIYILIKNINQYKKIILIILLILIFFFMLFILKNSFDFQLNSRHLGFQLIFDKLYYSLNFVSDPGNKQRLEFYKMFFDHFKFFGYGLGTTGTAAARFTDQWFGFESFGLAILYHGGFLSLPIGLILVLGVFLYNKPLTYKKIAIVFSYLSIMFAQQTFETPSVNIISWILILACFNHDKKLNNK